jgi:Zinc finger, C2H2 type
MELVDTMPKTPGKKPHVCPLEKNDKPCNRGFTRPYQLRQHIKVVHLGQKDHVCNYIINEETGEKCGKCFGHKDNLAAHMIDHTGDFPFVCEHLKEDGAVCVYGCKTDWCMTAHVMSNHTDKTSPEYLEYREQINQHQRERYANDTEYKFARLARTADHRFLKRTGGGE